MNKKISKSLSWQLLFSALISITAAIVCFVIVFLLGNFILDKTIYGETHEEKVEDRHFSELENYFKTEGITVDEINDLNEWCQLHPEIHISVYHDDRIIFVSDRHHHGEEDDDPKNESSAPNPMRYNIGREDPDHKYEAVLSDGTGLNVFLYFFADPEYYVGIVVIAIVLAYLVFSVTMVLLCNRKVIYIKQLKEELGVLSGGELALPVSVKGEDEIAELALGIDQMRKAIITHLKTEEEMRSANAELYTAMSHDLRTPLTSLMAYLEIIERKKYANEEQLQDLIHKCLNQTGRIRSMADKLFEYLLVYSILKEENEKEKIDADSFFAQIGEEYALSLEERGFIIEADYNLISGEFYCDPEMLHRAIDNIYSNLLKYADPSKPVKVYIGKEKNEVILRISNVINANREKIESNNIGLKTCERIIEDHGGSFTTEENDNMFIVTMILPMAESQSDE